MADEGTQRKAAVLLLLGLGGLAVIGLRRKKRDPIDDLPWEGVDEDDELGLVVEPGHPLGRQRYRDPSDDKSRHPSERRRACACPVEPGSQPEVAPWCCGIEHRSTPRKTSKKPSSGKQPHLPGMRSPTKSLPVPQLSPIPASGEVCKPSPFEIGKRVGGRRTLCLTRNQLATLQPDDDKIGCGAFACVYTRKGHRADVVKFTADPQDVAGLVANKHKNIAKVRAAYYLPEASDNHEVYAMVVERLEPLEFVHEAVLRAFPYERLDMNFGRHYGRNKESPDPDPTYQVPVELQDGIVRDVCRNFPTDESGGKACASFAHGIVELHQFLGKRGFNWYDIHPGNIRLTKQGQWKVIDLGLSGKDPKGIPVLADMPDLRDLLEDL